MLKEEAWHLGSSSSSGGSQPTSFLVCNETWGMPTQESAHLFMAPLLMPSKKCQQPECLPPNTDCQAAGWTITEETPPHVFRRELLPGLAEVRERVIPSTEYGTELFKWSVRRAPAFTALSGAMVTTHCLTLLLRDRPAIVDYTLNPNQVSLSSRAACVQCLSQPWEGNALARQTTQRCLSHYGLLGVKKGWNAGSHPIMNKPTSLPLHDANSSAHCALSTMMPCLAWPQRQGASETLSHN